MVNIYFVFVSIADNSKLQDSNIIFYKTILITKNVSLIIQNDNLLKYK